MFFTGFEKKERVAKYGDLYLCYGIEGGKEHWSFTPRTRQLLPDLRLKPATFGLQVQLSKLGHDCPKTLSGELKG